MQDIVEADECAAVAYLDRIKVQFDVSDLVVVQGHKACVLQARLPHEMFRFQRRNTFRVRTIERTSPTASVPPSRHPRHEPRAARARREHRRLRAAAAGQRADAAARRGDQGRAAVARRRHADRRRPDAASRHVHRRRERLGAAGLRDRRHESRRRSARCRSTSTRRRSAAG